MQQHAENFVAKMVVIRQRLGSIKNRQKEHFRQFKKLKIWNLYLKAAINVLNTISVTSLVLTFSGTSLTLIVCAVSNSLSAVGTAILSVVNMDAKVHSHQTSYLQFVELYDTNIAALLQDNLSGQDLDRILADLNAKVGLILDNCEPIEVQHASPRSRPHQSALKSPYTPDAIPYESPVYRARRYPLVLPQCPPLAPPKIEIIIPPS